MAKLRSPEQLDALLQLTRPWSWVALAILGAVIAITIVWGVLGSIPVQVQGLGLLLPENAQIYEVQSEVSGMVKALSVAANQSVSAGQQVAVIALPVDEVALLDAQRVLANARRRYDEQKAFTERDMASQRRVVADMNAATRKKIEDSTSYLAYLRKLLDDQTAEQKLGYITRPQTEATRTSIYNAEQGIAQAREAIAKNDLSLIEQENDARKMLEGLQAQTQDAQSRVDSLLATVRSEQTIVAPVTGIVAEVDVKPGVLVQAGGLVALIEQRSHGLYLIGYFKNADGKRLRPGMAASVSPLSVERDLYGSIRGTVTQVSTLPETQDSVQARTGNPTLAKQLMQAGAPISATIQLESDPSTPSGLNWTSSHGPNTIITAGETAAVSVVYQRKRPIDLVIPLFDAWRF